MLSLLKFPYTCSLIVLLTIFNSIAVNPSCKCMKFTSTYGKDWGLFTSPDYPQVYPTGIRCLLYTFIAPKGHIVHLQLDSFNLPKTQTPHGCIVGDYLKLFLHLEEDGVNELTPWNTLLCGVGKQKSFYSSSRFLIIQFHSSKSAPFRTFAQTMKVGFVGRFKFLNTSQFESSGRLVPGTKCDYQFTSANFTSAQGQFFSPNYPSTYPHNIKCAYYFHASLQERVKIIFASVNLQPHDYSCLNKTDVIRVLDGTNSMSSPVIALICNEVKEFEVVSSSPDLLVEFIANSEEPGNGFIGKFSFIKVEFDNPFDLSRLSQQYPSYGLGLYSTNGQAGLIQASTSTLVPQCNQIISSDRGPNGTLASPNYPHPYPSNTKCKWEFVGHGKERVQIAFQDFRLFSNENEAQGCNGMDKLSAFIQSNGNPEKLGDFCGSNIPLPMMSNGHRLSLELNASQSSRNSRGFSVTYSFVQDFGISGGRQLKDFPCAFVYNSSIYKNGSFWSPNYPGQYPRNTECHYFFYGQDNEHVDLHFTYFSLAGSEPCDESSESDYVELSNEMPVDPKYRRLCGTKSEFKTQSERNFFRVTFRSNSVLDGIGFYSVYSFCSKVGHRESGLINNGMSCAVKVKLGLLGAWISSIWCILTICYLESTILIRLG